VRTFEKRAGTGEKKGHKRMAQTGCVFDIGAVPRTPEQVMAAGAGGGRKAPRSLRRWYTIDIAADRTETTGAIFDEAERRDPRHKRPWVALVDGDNHQISLFEAQAAARGIDLVIFIDFIHVQEYLWKAGWCFHAPRDPAIETWVTAQALDILHGRAAHVAPAGAPAAPRPSCGCAPSAPTATWPPTGTGISSRNTSATTSAATRTAMHSPHNAHSRKATPTWCRYLSAWLSESIVILGR
jgi:hypothetical protein